MKSFAYTLDASAIPAKRIETLRHNRRVYYQCPDQCWRDHFDRWRKERQRGNENAPEPFPQGHCMFERPDQYACVPYGCTDPVMIRAAYESMVRGDLVGGGWTRDLPEEKVEQIIQATVDARMKGQDLGAAPFVACIYAAIL